MSATIETGIDRAWLLDLYERDPVGYAFARWDVDYAAPLCRFVTLRRDERPASFLLIWLGSPSFPIVHWGGDPAPERALIESFPPRPFIAIVPEAVVPAIPPVRGPVVASPLVVMVRPPRPASPRRHRAHVVRALGRHDLPELRRLTEGMDELTAGAYRALDPEGTTAYGGFLDGRLVGVARVQVALPEVWYVGGVFTAPGARNRGIGGDVTDALAGAAGAVGATSALVVREDNAPARRAYRRVGFADVGRRIHLFAAAEARA